MIDTTLCQLVQDVIPLFASAVFQIPFSRSSLRDFRIRMPLHSISIEPALDNLIANIATLSKQQSLDHLQEQLEIVADLLQFQLVLPKDVDNNDRYGRLQQLKACKDPTAVVNFDSLEKRNFLLKEVEKLDLILKEIVPPPPPEVLIDDDDDDERSIQRRYLLSDLNKIRTLLSECWSCACSDACRILHLNLGQLIDLDEPNPTSKHDYNFLFCSGQAFPNCRWQEASIVCQPLLKRAANMNDDFQAQLAPAMKVLSCCTVDQTNKTSHLCMRLQRGLKFKSKLLMEVRKDNLMIYDKLPPTKLRLKPGPGVQLSPIRAFLDQHRNTLDRRAIDELSLNLAVALLRLYDEGNTTSPWLQTNWVSRDGRLSFPEWINDVVFFPLANKTENPRALTTPYLRTQIDYKANPGEVEPHELDEIHHRDPGMLNLGKALLELNLRFRDLPIDSKDCEILEDDDDDDDEAIRANNEYFRCAELFDTYEDKLKDSYWLSKAIGACFELRQEDDIPIKDYIMSKIVRPLEMNKHSRSPSDQEVEKSLTILRAKTWNSEVQEMELTTNSLCLYGDGREEKVDKAIIEESDKWYSWFRTVHSRVYQNLEPKQKVKIAILDTGLELSDRQRDVYEVNQEFQFYSFICQPGEDPKLQVDDVGHGTHLACLLARLAPYASIYVARVLDRTSRNQLNSPRQGPTHARTIAKAIRHAVDEWEVDIITMSFGFPDVQDCSVANESMQKALEHANSKNVTLFAAASNDGKNRPDNVPWPARASEVILVHSASGYGTPSSFTPGPDDNQRVMTLGEHVKSAWPARFKLTGDVRYLGGTSCATPIAAAVAAVILDYARMHLDATQYKTLRKSEGMRKLFGKMKHDHTYDTTRYWWIQPWVFFRDEHSDRWIQDEIMEAIR